jgi:hypothetical protein
MLATCPVSYWTARKPSASSQYGKADSSNTCGADFAELRTGPLNQCTFIAKCNKEMRVGAEEGELVLKFDATHT